MVGRDSGKMVVEGDPPLKELVKAVHVRRPHAVRIAQGGTSAASKVKPTVKAETRSRGETGIYEKAGEL